MLSEEKNKEQRGYNLMVGILTADKDVEYKSMLYRTVTVGKK